MNDRLVYILVSDHVLSVVDIKILIQFSKHVLRNITSNRANMGYCDNVILLSSVGITQYIGHVLRPEIVVCT
jgi:hypothetical protein